MIKIGTRKLLSFGILLLLSGTTINCAVNDRVNHVFVSVKGEDTNPGTYEKPFRTLERASDRLIPGDTCFIFGGVYRECLKPGISGLPGQPIVFIPVPGETVTLSALEILTGGSSRSTWIEYPVETDLGHLNMVFLNGTPLTLARWPDKSNPDPMKLEPAVINASESSTRQIQSPELPGEWGPESLDGATVWVNAESKWSSWTSHVTGYDPGQKRIKLKGFGENWWVDERHNPSRLHRHYGEGLFFVAGAISLLNAPGEWHLDQENRLLRVILPLGISIENALVEMKVRDWTIDLSGTSDIQVVGIDLTGGPANLNGAENCVIEGSRISHFYASFGTHSTMAIPEESGIQVSGIKNTIRDCEIFGSNGSGIMLEGWGHRIINCDIHDANYIGSHKSALISLGGKGHFISHNTIHQTGRVCISMRGGAHCIQYNHIYNPGRNSEDLGVLKCAGMDCDNLVIHHNVIHNDNNKFIGIYFDNYTNNIIAHHNVVWGMQDGIRSNRPGHYHIVFNNTVIPDINNKWGPWIGPSDQFGNVFVNNIYRDTLMVKPEVFLSGNRKVEFEIGGADQIPVFKGESTLADFPGYLGALTGNKPFKFGHDFESPPSVEYSEKLPFIRNHVVNGCFDYLQTYQGVPAGKAIQVNGLEHWEKIHAQKATVEKFPGFNFPVGPDQRNSIYGYSLMLGKNGKDGVRQKITTLRAGREYQLGAYVKTEQDSEVEFSLSMGGDQIVSGSTDETHPVSEGGWKFVSMDFRLEDPGDEIYLNILKSGDGIAFVDDVGIIPLPAYDSARL